MVSIATLRRPHEIKGLHVAYVSSKNRVRLPNFIQPYSSP